MAEIRVYHGDTFICHAACQELAGQTISLKEIIATRNRRRRQLREQPPRAAHSSASKQHHRPHASRAGRAARPASRHTSDCAAIGALTPKA